MPEITNVEAWEVLDSRGHPTVRATVEAGRVYGRFTVPSGASTGAHEAHERRDGGTRYAGLGVSEAVAAIESDLRPVVEGRDVTEQETIDAALVATDGTERLERVGANAVLAVSGAVCHAGARATNRPLCRYLGDGALGRLPMPMVNVLSGGHHAPGGLAVQDFLVVPVGAGTYSEAVELAWAVRQAVRDRILAAGDRPLLADEGGFAPALADVDAAFDVLTGAIEDVGLALGSEVAIALDVAATHLYDADTGTYELEGPGTGVDLSAMVATVQDWIERYPIVSVEDPLHEDDWAGWQELADEVGAGVQILADDLVATNEARLERAIETETADAVLIKPNQAGTISRTLRVLDAAKDAGIRPVVSARSGETCDATIADLAVGHDAGQIKIGSLARSERLAKYNRLFEIERRYAPDFAGREPFQGF